MSGARAAACHELLLRLAGRLPDELLWRMRDWLADGGQEVLASTLPRELLRHRAAITDDERELLETAVGSTHPLVDAVHPAAEPPPTQAEFEPGNGAVDTAALAVLAVVRGHPGCVELRQSWRGGQRIVLVIGAERPWELAGTLQRVMRAHGDRTPCVEVLPAHGERSSYHQAAIIGSRPLWRSATALVGA
ncbi:MAG TPA: hypothetical protein VKZ81_25440 [Pseudonocardia sp.]|uniref:hypothetical protein n=1 Tax=Pseudonocardia sp. TaxID=60912 RepID=UPI002B4B2668|nr:hypothetical protein [Pseudonocardia sp.]HLU58819.1 hypothetical protein [Pseudonocardia sp.]